MSALSKDLTIKIRARRAQASQWLPNPGLPRWDFPAGPHDGTSPQDLDLPDETSRWNLGLPNETSRRDLGLPDETSRRDLGLPEETSRRDLGLS